MIPTYLPGGRTLSEIIADLSMPIPPEYLKEKTKGGAKLTIFEWMTAQRFLDIYAPGWQGRATLTYSNERVGCVYEICIPTSDAGLVCRAASGDDSEDDEDETEQERRQRNYGSPTTRAEGQAFKRATTRFGFGLYLRDKRHGQQAAAAQARPQNGRQPAQPPPGPSGPTLVERMRSAANTLGYNASQSRVEMCQVLGLDPQIEKRDASTLWTAHPKHHEQLVRHFEALVRGRQALPPSQPGDDPDFDKIPSAGAAPATANQIKAVYSIGRASKRLSERQVEDRCAEVFGVAPAELTKAEASQFIEMLKGEAGT